jgi:hypothetical protein
VGLGYRRELAAAICAHLDEIDVLEVLADDYLDAPASDWRALRTLGRAVPLTLHGVGLGLASREPVEGRRLERLARLVDAVQPEAWSEHLAFVRGGGRELGHLAAPARVASTIEGTARNLTRARAVIGTLPQVENVATLVDPPGSVLAEDEWVARVLAESGAELLLDLHNLYTNAHNLGFDAEAWLQRVPLERVAAVHLSGGRWVGPPGSRRRLDDHLHDVPEPVYDLLEHVAGRAPQALTVILERDGAYPSIELLLAQLDRARRALRLGRVRARAVQDAGHPPFGPGGPPGDGGREAPTEAELVTLYTDAGARAAFTGGMPGADRVGLELAAAGFARKRAQAASRPRQRSGPLAWLLRRLAGLRRRAAFRPSGGLARQAGARR